MEDIGGRAGDRLSPSLLHAKRPCCMNPARDTVIPQVFVAYAIRTDSGRSNSSMRFSARTAMPPSVARHASLSRVLRNDPAVFCQDRASSVLAGLTLDLHA